jgi:Flp pilus assembly protein protease CpaA
MSTPTLPSSPASPQRPRRRWVRGVCLIALVLALAVAITLFLRLHEAQVSLLPIYVGIVLLIAACTDAVKGLIPNSLTYAAALASCALLLASSTPPKRVDCAACQALVFERAAEGSLHDQHLIADEHVPWLEGPGPLRGLAATAAVAVFALALFFVGAWGGGDTKLVIAIAPCLPLGTLLTTLILATTFALALAALNACSRGALLRLLPSLVQRLTKPLAADAPAFDFPKGRVPFAPPLFTAYLIATLLVPAFEGLCP